LQDSLFLDPFGLKNGIFYQLPALIFDIQSMAFDKTFSQEKTTYDTKQYPYG
jgi:hypothetical protein